MNDIDYFALDPGRNTTDKWGRMVASNIRIMREKRKMTQTELGKKVGVTRGVVSKTESGDASPTLVKLCAYAWALKVHPGLLLAEDIESSLFVDKGKQFTCD